MTITIDNAFVDQYKGMVSHLAQQKENKLRQFVTEVDSKGKSYNFDRLASTSMVAKTLRRESSKQYYVDDTWSRRVAVPSSYVHMMTIEQEDKVQMLIDPQSAYAENQAMAVNRKYDELIIAAAIGNALDGDGGSNALPGGQTVGDGATAIDFSFVTQVVQKFLANDIDLSIPKVFVVGPVQVRQLMNLTQATSGDYVAREALQKLNATGIVPNWMGFTWIVKSDLATLSVPDTGEVGCLAFTKQALGLAVNADMIVRIGENPERAYLTQVFAEIVAGAVRVEDEHIVRLRVLNS